MIQSNLVVRDSLGARAFAVSLVLLPMFLLAATPAASAQDEGEFSAHGAGVTRIENEVKLRVPTEDTEAMWQWLQERYTDATWLDRDGHVFRAGFGDEDFTDVYFDTPELKMLEAWSGVRHRSRVVHSGPAGAKDDRQLLQFKLNRKDSAGLSRSEIKFDISPSQEVKTVDDTHPMLGLVKKSQREEVKSLCLELGLDPYAMRPILVIEQNRRRVYVSDQQGAFATLTLDRTSTDSGGKDLRWVELELELNEIRYTESEESDRKWMEQVNETILSDVQLAFPGVVQDQTPKYNKAFAAIEAATWMPWRRLVQIGMNPSDFVTVLLVAVGAGVAAVLFGSVQWRRRKRLVSGSRRTEAIG